MDMPSPPRRKCLTRCPKVDRSRDRRISLRGRVRQCAGTRAVDLGDNPAAKSDRVCEPAQATMAPTVLSVRATAEEALVQATANQRVPRVVVTLRVEITDPP
jgi:hypothetical protein